MNNSLKPKRILISAGELSGDEHAANLLGALKRCHINFEAQGMGGANMRVQGAKLIVNIEESGSVMGFGDVFQALPAILRSLRDMRRLIKLWKPDLLILVDYPDFNLRLAKSARKHSVPVLYFIPPTVWAWRKSRLNLIKKYVNKAALIYPFEEKFYRENGYENAHFVGHPFCEHIPPTPPAQREREEFLRANGLDPARPVVAVFPGSRWGEIERHMGPVISAIEIFHARHPEVQYAIGLASGINRERLSALIPERLPVTLCSGDALMLLRCADTGLLKSGTSNLQAAFAGLPFCMFYVTTRLGAFLGRRLISVKEFSIVNLIRPKSIKEIIQEEVTGESLARELEKLLFDQGTRAEIRQRLSAVVSDLTNQSKSSRTTADRTAQLALSLLG